MGMPVRRALLASAVGAIVGLVVTHRAFGTPVVLFSPFLFWIFLLLLWVAGFLTIFLLAPATRTMTSSVRAGLLGGGVGALWGALIVGVMFLSFDAQAMAIGAGIGLLSGATAGLVFAERGGRAADLERARRADPRSMGHAAAMALVAALVVFGLHLSSGVLWSWHSSENVISEGGPAPTRYEAWSVGLQVAVPFVLAYASAVFLGCLPVAALVRLRRMSAVLVGIFTAYVNPILLPRDWLQGWLDRWPGEWFSGWMALLVGFGVVVALASTLAIGLVAQLARRWAA